MRKLSLPYFVAAAATLAAAATYEASVFGALQWRSIGPKRGGRSITSAGSPSRPNEYYFGATGGGLWKTTDGGTTWRPVTDGQIHSSSVGAVAVSESNPDIVYIGMGEAELRGNIMQGDGVYKSTDAGKTWKNVGLDRHAGHLAHPRSSHQSRYRLRRRARPSLRAANGARRLPLRDGGKTWQKILYRDDHAGAVDLSLDPHNPDVLYAAIWDVVSHSVDAVSGGPGSGFYKSTDGGDHWTEITRNPGLPRGHHRQDRRVRFRRRFESRLRHGRKRGRRRLRLRRCRRDLEAASAKIATCASAPSTTPASTPIRKTRTPSTCSTPAFTNRPMAARPSAPLRRAARRQSRPVDRPRPIRCA